MDNTIACSNTDMPTATVNMRWEASMLAQFSVRVARCMGAGGSNGAERGATARVGAGIGARAAGWAVGRAVG